MNLNPFRHKPIPLDTRPTLEELRAAQIPALGDHGHAPELTEWERSRLIVRAEADTPWNLIPRPGGPGRDAFERMALRGTWLPQDDADCRAEIGKLLDRKCDETGRPRSAVALHLVGMLAAEAAK